MRIDIYSDIACPWCYIGERRLERALAERPDVTVERRWMPFQLRPERPATGVPWSEYIEQKFGGPDKARAAFQRVIEAGRADGITFDYDHIASAPNTLNAHRLALFAEAHDRVWQVVEGLFAAHFTDGQDINDPEVLVAIGTQAGLDPDGTRAYLASDEGIEEVRASQEQAYQYGINAVPCFVFDDRFAVSGAQPIEVFFQAFDLAQSEHPLPVRG